VCIVVEAFFVTAVFMAALHLISLLRYLCAKVLLLLAVQAHQH
jgi:hypothetical protein